MGTGSRAIRAVLHAARWQPDLGQLLLLALLGLPPRSPTPSGEQGDPYLWQPLIEQPFLCGPSRRLGLAAQRLIEAVPSGSDRFARAPVQRIDLIGPRRRARLVPRRSAAAAAKLG